MATKASKIIKYALSHIPEPGPGNKTIHLALSGGVDSSVTGLLLRERGYDVKPTLLRCWDMPAEDTISSSSSSSSSSCFERELRNAEGACEALRLGHELRVIDLVSSYWTEVFENVLLSGLQRGQTPNVDLACNRRVKFDIFPRVLRGIVGRDGKKSSSGSGSGSDSGVGSSMKEREGKGEEEEEDDDDDDDDNDDGIRIATGHYARLRKSKNDRNEKVELLYGVDERKDQSYFLASVHWRSLTRFMMPLGHLTKTDVRQVAEHMKLPCTALKSSRGMCFIGKQSFPEFVAQFLPPQHEGGRFIHAGSRVDLGACAWPTWAYTVGQRARIGGLEGRLFVVGVSGSDVLVTEEGDWRLFTDRIVCPRVDWIAESEPQGLSAKEGDGGAMHVEFKCCSTQRRQRGVMYRNGNENDDDERGGVVIVPGERQRRVSDGQAVVIYRGEVCLGAAWPRDQRDWEEEGVKREKRGYATR